MVELRSLLVVIFLSTFSSGRADMNGSGVLLQTNESSDINEGKRYSSGSTSKSDYDISPNPTRTTSSIGLDKTSLNMKTRLSFCCSFGVGREYGSCLKNNTIANIMPRIATWINGQVRQKEVSMQNFDLVIDDPCNFDWMVPSLLNNFSVLENGSISDKDSSAETLYDLEHYCLFRNPEAVDYLARVCYPLIRMSNWECFCATALMLIMLAVFIVYSVIPESKNLHGMMFRAYIGTYLTIAVGSLAAELTTELKTNAYLYSFSGTKSDTTVRYGSGSCACWLNAMSFNIWRSIWSLKPIDFYTRESENRKFIYYAVYAWGTPVIVLMAILFPVYYLPYLGHEILGYNVRLWLYVGAVATIYTCNAICSMSTVLTIRYHQKDMACIVNGVNRHNNIDLEWFNLYIKLFIFMGGHIVMWIIWLLKPTQTIVQILGTLEVIQAIAIFVIFVWKDNIKRSFRERLLTALTRGQNNSS